MALWTPQTGPQVDAAICPADFTLFGGSRGGGKMSPMDSDVCTPFGFRKMGDLRPDDTISNPNGSPQKVLRTWDHPNKDVWKIEFIDGASLEVGLEHLWLIRKTLHKTKKKKAETFNGTWGGELWSTEQIGRFLEQNSDANLLIPLTTPVRFTKSYRVDMRPIDPYFLGLLIGDGSFTQSAVKFSSGDEEIINSIKDLGYRVSGYSYSNYLIHNENGLLSHLNKIGLQGKRSEEKFIPQSYLYATVDDRISLVQGLMDTDGYVDGRGHMHYTTTSQQLGIDFQWLIRSIGGKATITDKIPTYSYKGEKKTGLKAYTVYFNTHFNKDLVRLTRKRDRAKNDFNGGVSTLSRRIANMEYVGKKDCRCITVSDPNGLYIADDFIVTHNTDCLIGRHLRGVEKYNYKWNGLVVRRKYKEFSKIRNRVDELIREGLPAERIGGDQQVNTVRFSNGGKFVMSAIQRVEMCDDHVGEDYTEISIDECTTFPFFMKMVDKLSGSLRSAHGVPCRMFGTGNPGGPGHNDVKLAFKLGSEFNIKPGTVMYDDLGESRVFIPSFLKDNKILCENDPKYVRRLMSIRDPMLRKAWLDGNWDVYIGQAFMLSPDHHIIKPLPVPGSAPLYMTFDWGWSAPFSIGWWWVDADGRIYRFAEWYGWDEKENEGLKMLDSEIAKGIIQRELDLGISGKPIIRLSDPTCFNKKPDYKGGGSGPSTAEEFRNLGITLRPGDPNRKLKIRQFRERLSIPEDGKTRPMLQVYDTCRHFISTIPSLCMDEENVEDIDTDQADHTYDEACHIAMARPLKLVEIQEKKKSDLDPASMSAQKEYENIIAQIQAEQNYSGRYG